MPIEIEKKYRLKKAQVAAVRRRLRLIGAQLQGQEFEENTLYRGKGLQVGKAVLRLRRVGNKAILTYKKRYSSRSSIKRQLEEETLVGDPHAVDSILKALGFTPALVYEKRRETWMLGDTEIAVDELPFGMFMEIEGKPRDIKSIEAELAIEGLVAEHSTYPELTVKNGTRRGGRVEARFKPERSRR